MRIVTDFSRNYRSILQFATLATIFLVPVFASPLAQDLRTPRDTIGLFARGRVTAVHTGDQFTMDLGPITVRLRLKNLNTPDLEDPFGHEARRLLASMILNRHVSILYDQPDLTAPDRVPHAEIFAQGTNIIHHMLQHGLARTAAPAAGDPQLEEIQLSALKDGIGIWAHADVHTPRGSEIYAGRIN